MVLGFVTIEINGLQLLPKCAYDFLVNFSVWFKKFFCSIGINVELKDLPHRGGDIEIQVVSNIIFIFVVLAHMMPKLLVN